MHYSVTMIYFHSNMLIKRKSIIKVLDYIERLSNFPDVILFNDIKSDVMCRVNVPLRIP